MSLTAFDLGDKKLHRFNAHESESFSGVSEVVRQGMRYRCLTDTFYLAAVVLGYEMLTVHTHAPLCTFLDTCKATRRLIQMPRSHFKTTIVTVAKRIQNILRDPTVRILIVGDTETNAQKHLAKIRLQFERNRMLRWLFPELIWKNLGDAPAWSKNQIYVPVTHADGSQTTAIHGEPTVDTVGARGAVVSRHYDIINADDLIGEDEYYSSVEMDKTIDWFTGLESLFVPPVDEGLLDIPSTFWRTDDVYSFAERFYGEGEEPISTGPFSYQRGSIAVFRRGVRENGKLIFPEGVSEKFVNRLQKENPERYAAQYANNPKASGVAFFTKEYKRFYQVRGEKLYSYKETDESLVKLVSSDAMEIYSMCDPAASDKGAANRKQIRLRSSKAAVITTGVLPENGYIFILDCWVRRQPPNEIVDEIFRQNELWLPQLFSIEANGMQKMLKFWIEERAQREGLPDPPYHPFIPKGPKDSERRIRGLQPLFRAGMIWAQVGFSELWEEYDVWPRGREDALDCLSQGLEHWAVGYDSRSEEEKEREYEDNVLPFVNVATGY